jgi:hypothetical protein
MVDCEQNGLTLAKRHDRDAGLHTWALFGQDKFAPGEVLSGSAEQKSCLDGKDEFAVEILMQAVAVVPLIFEQEWCGLSLPCLMTSLLKVAVLRRVNLGVAEGLIPFVGDGRERGIEGLAKRLDRGGKGIGIVLVLTSPESMARHDDTTPKLLGICVSL